MNFLKYSLALWLPALVYLGFNSPVLALCSIPLMLLAALPSYFLSRRYSSMFTKFLAHYGCWSGVAIIFAAVMYLAAGAGMAAVDGGASIAKSELLYKEFIKPIAYSQVIVVLLSIYGSAIAWRLESKRLK